MRPHIKAHLTILSQRYSLCVDPFAGDGHLLRAVAELGITTAGHDLDISICKRNGWGAPNDSIRNVVLHEDAFVLTNPPYLAKNSAKRLGSNMVEYFEDGAVLIADSDRYGILNDLFKLAIERTIAHYDDSVWIVPESVVQDLDRLPHWRKRLHSLTILEQNPFTDTEHPVCVCVFTTSSPEGVIWKNDERLGTYDELRGAHDAVAQATSTALPMKFNAPNGALGYRAVDGTKADGSMRIKFCSEDNLNYDRGNIKISSRHMTYIDTALSSVELEPVILEANRRIEAYRKATSDVFLTAFMGNTKLGIRRRRLDYNLARRIFNQSYLAVKNPFNRLH